MNEQPSQPSQPNPTGQPLRDPRVKVWPLSRIIVVSCIYLALATGGAWISMGVAMDRVADMGHYQVQKTREFLGPERAKELDEFMHPTAFEDEQNENEQSEGDSSTADQAPEGETQNPAVVD